MANQNGRPIAPARKLVAAVVGTIAVFVMLFGLGMSSWAIVALGLAMLILAIALGMVNVVRRGARAWVAGSAQVKAISEPPATAIYGRAELQIVIVAPGLPTSEVTVRDPRVPVAKWPRVGDTLPVTVDVDDMRRVRINWDEAETYDTGTLNVPPTYYEEDLPDDDLLGGEPEPPPWANRDRQWGRGPDEPPPPPPPSPRLGDLDGPPPPPPQAGLLDDPPQPVIVRDAPGGPILEGQLVEPDYEYSAPLPQRARTATATPPRPAEKPRPRPRPHATATLDPEDEGTGTEPPEAAPEPAPTATSRPPSSTVADNAQDEPVSPAPAQPAPEPASNHHDPEIDLPLDGDPEPPPEQRSPAARAAVDEDIIAPPAATTSLPDPSPTPPPSGDRAGRVLDAEGAPPRQRRPRSAEDDLLGDLEPPPWEVRAQQPASAPDPEAVSAAPDRVPASAAAPDLDPAPAAAPPRSIAEESRPAPEARPKPRPRPTSPPDEQPAARSSTAQTTGLAAAAGAVVAAGFAALGNAFRNKKQEDRTPSPDAAQSPSAPNRPDPVAATGSVSATQPPPNDPDPAVPPSVTSPAASEPGSASGEPPKRPNAASGPTSGYASASSSASASAPESASGSGPASDADREAESDLNAAASGAVSATHPRPAPAAAPGQVYASPTAFGPGGGSGSGNPADIKPRPEPTPPRPGTVYAAETAAPDNRTPASTPPPATGAVTARVAPASSTPAGAPTPKRGRPWADLEGGFEPDERADDLITAYPSARPGPAGAIHGVGITVLVTNLDRSVAFYRDMLGFFEIDTGSGSAVLASGDTRLVLRTVHDLSGVAGRLIYLNLEVGDVEAVYEELKRKGVKFVHGPRPVNRGDKLELWAASFHDPDQHNIAITQWRAIH